MANRLIYTQVAEEHLITLRNDPSKKRILKDVVKALGYMEVDLRHPSLNTHQFYSLSGPNGEKIFEAYAQQATPGAYRIFWYYGPGKNVISIIAIIPHP
jgi:hypothetical protein